jgi:hypothetical protein
MTHENPTGSSDSNLAITAISGSGSASGSAATGLDSTNTTSTRADRRHDMDALRAAAMLLGIVYHAALSLALGFGWFTQDPAADKGMYVFQSWVHGFRMHLFFIVSGFFTAMLWQKRGALSLVWHRFRRVLLPCLVGLVTVVPISNMAIGYVMFKNGERATQNRTEEPATASIWAAIRKFDSAAVADHLKNGVDPSGLHPDFKITPLTWAALVGDGASARLLLDIPTDPNVRNEDKGTPLHAAAFLGRSDIAMMLLERGADIDAIDSRNETPLMVANGDLNAVPFIAGILGLTAEPADVKAGRALIIAELTKRGAVPKTLANVHEKTRSAAVSPLAPSSWTSWWFWLIYNPVFSFLWFLWFLWWLVVLYALLASLLAPLKLPSWTLNWVRYPVAIPVMILLTILPYAWMQSPGFVFGPDTSMGILPMPHMFCLYGLFFFFGTLYFLSDDSQGHLGSQWRWLLPLTMLVVFPLALDASTGTFGLRDAWIPTPYQKSVSVFGQSVFAWLMSISCIGLFRSCFSKNTPWIRYTSDASYWLYVTHLPPVVLAQYWVQDIPGPALWKLVLISFGVTGFLLVLYQLFVRNTWIGVFLNGSRPKSAKPAEQSPNIPIPSTSS